MAAYGHSPRASRTSPTGSFPRASRDGPTGKLSCAPRLRAISPYAVCFARGFSPRRHYAAGHQRSLAGIAPFCQAARATCNRARSCDGRLFGRHYAAGPSLSLSVHLDPVPSDHGPKKLWLPRSDLPPWVLPRGPGCLYLRAIYLTTASVESVAHCRPQAVCKQSNLTVTPI
jgi:hypothetical protein